ncbi:hypothetical protein ACFFR1_15745 [Micromonospora sagamiensis]
MITLTDIASRDIITLAVMDSHEEAVPHALLAVTVDTELRAYGPFAGSSTAGAYAARLALAQPDVVATRPVPLHCPSERDIPSTAWIDAPHTMADMVTARPADTAVTCLILLDRANGSLVAVGPFTTPREADGWRPQPDHEASRFVVALQQVMSDGD